jgi:hypothetical protein
MNWVGLPRTRMAAPSSLHPRSLGRSPRSAHVGGDARCPKAAVSPATRQLHPRELRRAPRSWLTEQILSSATPRRARQSSASRWSGRVLLSGAGSANWRQRTSRFQLRRAGPSGRPSTGQLSPDKRWASPGHRVAFQLPPARAEARTFEGLQAGTPSTLSASDRSLPLRRFPEWVPHQLPLNRAEAFTWRGFRSGCP